MDDFKCDIQSEVRQYYDYLLSFPLKKVPNREIAEDLTQEVFYQLTLSCKKTEEIENVKAWLFRVARNVLYKYYNQKPTEIDLDDNSIHHTSEREANFPEVDMYITEMIDALPESSKEVLTAIDIQGKSYKELSEDLGIGLSAAKMRVKRARELLLHSFYDTCDITFDKSGNFVSCKVKDA